MAIWIWVREHASRVIGVCLGIVAGVLCLTIGFWRTLLLVLLGVSGYLIGFFIEDKEGFIFAFNRIISFFRRK